MMTNEPEIAMNSAGHQAQLIYDAPMYRHALVTLGILAATSCATPGVSSIRFQNEAPVWQVNDRVDILAPEAQGFARLMYYFDRFFFRSTTRLLEVPLGQHAANVNSLDEVPNSTWFTNRMGNRALTVKQVRNGPNVGPGLDAAATWQVTGTKVGGVSAGLMIKGPKGARYILKFDEKGIPETETASNVVLQRLFWAAGFNVPQDSIVIFRRSQLVLAKDATVKDTFGNKRPMTEADLDAQLARANLCADGRYRGMASKFLKGVPLGGIEPEGTREDDANDVVNHEDRRDLRGQYVIFSWTNHTDIKLDNLLDMWVQDSANPNLHYVMHYLVDFGKGLGTLGLMNNTVTDGFAYSFDSAWSLFSLLSAGVDRRPWEGADGPKLRGVGRFEATRFQANSWSPRYPWTPFKRRDRFDGFWGAKIVAAFTPAHIRAAVSAGRYSDPRAANYVARVLGERRRKIMRYWFGQVTPLVKFRMTAANTLCFDDLAIRYQVSGADQNTTYAADSYNYAGSKTARLSVTASKCISGIRPGPNQQGYTIIKIATRRGRTTMPAVEVHLAQHAGKLRVIGLRRR